MRLVSYSRVPQVREPEFFREPGFFFILKRVEALPREKEGGSHSPGRRPDPAPHGHIQDYKRQERSGASCSVAPSSELARLLSHVRAG
jgi:hypothetical protein